MGNKEQHTRHGQQVLDRAFLFSELKRPNTILLESSRHDENNNRNLLFSSPIAILSTNSLSEIPSIFEKVEAYLQNNKWIAGYVSSHRDSALRAQSRWLGNQPAPGLVFMPLYKGDSPGKGLPLSRHFAAWQYFNFFAGERP